MRFRTLVSWKLEAGEPWFKTSKSRGGFWRSGRRRRLRRRDAGRRHCALDPCARHRRSGVLARDGSERGDELITLYNSRPAAPQFQTLSYPDYTAARDRLRGDVDVAAFVRISNTLGGHPPAQVWGELVSGNYFDVLRTTPLLGRLLTAEDDRPQAPPVVVIGEGLWRRSFGADPTIVGKPLRIGRDDYTVVGITRRGFQGPAWSSEFWVPLSMSRQILGGDYLLAPEIPLLQTVGRASPSCRWPSCTRACGRSSLTGRQTVGR